MKNFLKGYGSILTMISNHQLPKLDVKDLHQSDEEALRKDWESVGRDIRIAMEKIDDERSR